MNIIGWYDKIFINKYLVIVNRSAMSSKFCNFDAIIAAAQMQFIIVFANRLLIQ